MDKNISDRIIVSEEPNLFVTRKLEENGFCITCTKNGIDIYKPTTKTMRKGFIFVRNEEVKGYEWVGRLILENKDSNTEWDLSVFSRGLVDDLNKILITALDEYETKMTTTLKRETPEFYLHILEDAFDDFHC